MNCIHQLKENKEEGYVFCSVCGKQWRINHYYPEPAKDPFIDPLRFKAKESCMWDNVPPNTPMMMVCPCSNCRITC